MMTPNFLLLYVADPLASARFYSKILNAEPVEQSPGFALFVMPGGWKLGLWLRSEVVPNASGTPGEAEICFSCLTLEEVRQREELWKSWGLPILAPTAKLDFGWTFTAADPDGHRLRVFFPQE